MQNSVSSTNRETVEILDVPFVPLVGTPVHLQHELVSLLPNSMTTTRAGKVRDKLNVYDHYLNNATLYMVDMSSTQERV